MGCAALTTALTIAVRSAQIVPPGRKFKIKLTLDARSLELLTIRRILDVCPLYYLPLSCEECSTNRKLGVWAV